MAETICRTIDAANRWAGKTACWLFVPLMLIVTLDVTLRYLFNRPTAWAWDVNVQLAGALVLLGGGYAFVEGGHIGIDVLVTGLSPRKRALIDVITFFFFLFAIGVLVWHGTQAAWVSVQSREVLSTYFAPPIYPFKCLMAVGFLLLLLQGTAKFIRDLSILIRKA